MNNLIEYFSKTRFERPFLPCRRVVVEEVMMIECFIKENFDLRLTFFLEDLFYQNFYIHGNK